MRRRASAGRIGAAAIALCACAAEDSGCDGGDPLGDIVYVCVADEAACGARERVHQSEYHLANHARFRFESVQGAVAPASTLLAKPLSDGSLNALRTGKLVMLAFGSGSPPRLDAYAPAFIEDVASLELQPHRGYFINGVLLLETVGVVDAVLRSSAGADLLGQVPVRWSVDDPNVARVEPRDSTCQVTALRAGTTQLRADYDGRGASFALTVLGIAPDAGRADAGRADAGDADAGDADAGDADAGDADASDADLDGAPEEGGIDADAS